MNAINTNTNRGNQIFIQISTTPFVYKPLFYKKKEEEVTARRHLRKLLLRVGSYSGIFILSFSEYAIIVCQTFGSVVMLKTFFWVDVVG